MRFILGLMKPRRIIIGTDFAGSIVSFGKDVSGFHVGDKVFGFRDTGAESQAEYLSISAEEVFRIPAKINYINAAASLEGAHYAYSFVHKTNIQSGQKILINGASGAIGSALLQFVSQFDVQITATCNSKNIELIKSSGADKVFDYTKEDFRTDTYKYDYIFDAVGKSTFGDCRPLLKNGGTYISSELGPYSQNVFYAIFSSFMKKKVIFPIPFSSMETIPYIIDLLEKGVYKPVVDRTYPLSEISEAYAYVMTGQKTGSVTISI